MKKKSWLTGLVVAVVVIAAAAGGALWWLGGNVDRLVKEAVERYGSEMLGAKVAVQSVELKASGEGIVKGLVIGNPKGFKTAHLAKVGQFDVVIDLASLTGDVVHVKRIAIEKPDLIYERGDGLTNVDAIQKNIAAYLGPQKKSPGPERKLIVDLLTIRGANAQASAGFMGGKTVEFSLPDIALKDVGKAKGGVTPGELGQIVAGAMEKQILGVFSFDRIKSAVGGAVDGVKNLFK